MDTNEQFLEALRRHSECGSGVQDLTELAPFGMMKRSEFPAGQPKAKGYGCRPGTLVA